MHKREYFTMYRKNILILVKICEDVNYIVDYYLSNEKM